MELNEITQILEKVKSSPSLAYHEGYDGRLERVHKAIDAAYEYLQETPLDASERLLDSDPDKFGFNKAVESLDDAAQHEVAWRNHDLMVDGYDSSEAKFFAYREYLKTFYSDLAADLLERLGR